MDTAEEYPEKKADDALRPAADADTGNVPKHKNKDQNSQSIAVDTTSVHQQDHANIDRHSLASAPVQSASANVSQSSISRPNAAGSSSSVLHRAWQKVVNIVTWVPPYCRWDPGNPPKFGMGLNLVFTVVCIAARCQVFSYISVVIRHLAF